MLDSFHSHYFPAHQAYSELESFISGYRCSMIVTRNLMDFHWVTKNLFQSYVFEKFLAGVYTPHIIIFLLVPILLCFCAYFEKQAPYYTYSSFSGWISCYILFFAFFNSCYPLLCDIELISYDCYRGTAFADLLTPVIILFSFIACIMSIPYVLKTRTNTYEFYILLLISCVSMICLIRADDFITLYLCIELQALCFYILASYKRTSLISVEAGLKYFSLSAMASGILLFGITCIYYSTGSIDFNEIHLVLSALASLESGSFYSYTVYPIVFGILMILGAFLFKLPAAPFHMWAADVYEGSPTASTGYFLSVPKLSLFAVLSTLLLKTFSPLLFWWQPALLLISALSLFIGYFSALGQTSVKRFFVYSGVSHVGFMLLALCSPEVSSQLYSTFTSRVVNFDDAMASTQQIFPLFFYLFSYTIMIIAAMTFILLNSNGFHKNTGRLTHYGVKDLPMFHTNPYYSFFVLFLFFSFIGIPPTLGFFSKYYVLKGSLLWSSSLIFFGVLFVMITLTGFVYGRLISYMYFKDINLNFPRHWWSSTVPSRVWSRLFVGSVLLTIVFFVYPTFLLDIVDLLDLSFLEDAPYNGEDKFSEMLANEDQNTFFNRALIKDRSFDLPWIGKYNRRLYQ